MKYEEAVEESSRLFPEPMDTKDIGYFVGVPFGDVLRIIRNVAEGKRLDTIDEVNLATELMNVAVTCGRAVKRLGLDPEAVLEASIEAQTNYVLRNT